MEMNIAVLLPVIGALTVLTNIIVEVLKKGFRTIPANIIAVAVSEVLTVLSFLAWSDMQGAAVTWYYFAGAVVVGFLVSYAAMFGFDKLKETLERLGK